MFLTKQFVGRTIALCDFRWEETVKLEFDQRADLVDIRRIGIPRAFQERGVHPGDRRDAPVLRSEPFMFNIDDFEFRTREVVCGHCANHCEIVCVYRDQDLIDSWGNRCDRGAIRPKPKSAVA